MSPEPLPLHPAPPPADADEVDWGLPAEPEPRRAPKRANGGHAPPARQPTPPPADERLSPQSLEAERAVLGSILIDETALERVGPLIGPDSFYRGAHAAIYAAMLALARSSSAIDLVTVSAELRRSGRLDEVGGSAYLTSLMHEVPTAVHAEHYARIVAMKALARRAIADAGRLAAIGYEDANDPDELLARLRSIVAGIEASWTASAGGAVERLGARLLTELSMEPPPPMLLGRLDPFGSTVLFGTGGTGKGLIAAWWILHLAREGHRVLVADYENHPDEWSRRVYAMGGAHLMERIVHVAPLTSAWGGRRGALWDHAADLGRLALETGADYLAIDSIVPACAGADPLKPETVSQYVGALELIGLPSLSLGHVTKADDLRYPFGSVFWHNLSRVTWSAKRDGESIALVHRKHNNYESHAPTLLTVSWVDGLPVSVDERPAGEVLAERIAAALGDGPLTVRQIVAALDADLDEDAEPTKPDSVSRTLRRGLLADPPRFVRVGSDRWARA